jgi:anti-sigma factor RsiW
VVPLLIPRQKRLSVAQETSCGFTVLSWRDGRLGYALISDVNRVALEMLTSRINAE